MKKHVVTDEEITHFNLFRENMKGKECSRSEMMKQIREKLGYKVWDALFKSLSDGVNPPIIRIRKGVYVVNPKPVYKDRLQLVFDSLASDNKKYQNKRDKSQMQISITEAITLLKNNGYKIYKQIIKYEEV